jgi:folate-dependent phosphoribosylglycinamide formyltransferase PurN
MRTLLLTKKSPFQIYCANYLFEKGILTDVILEEGSSFGRSHSSIFEKLKVFSDVKISFHFLYYKIVKLICNKKFYGNIDFFNKAILIDNYENFNNELNVHRVNSANDYESILLIKQIKPEIVYIFGTGILKKRLIDSIICPKINMHFGLSPYYRGQGIVTALAIEGPQSVGVTIHYLDTNVDSGDIIFQDVPQINKYDNFYSIALKLTKIGSEAFYKVYIDLRGNNLKSFKQDLSLGKLYDNTFMKNNQHFYIQAWKVIKKL